jgi:protein-disulfide isomerase
VKMNKALSTLLIAGTLTTSVGISSAYADTTTATTTAPASTATFTPGQVNNIEKIVHDYLVQHPEVLVEASKALQQKMQEKQQKEAVSVISKNAQELFNDPNSPVVGNPNGSVTIVEFFDYQCGHCKEMSKTMQDLLTANKNVKLVLKELPIFGGNSQIAAKAALASVKQGKFYAFHKAMLGASNPLNKDKIFDTAKSVGLNIDQLKKDMESPEVAAQVKANFKLAQTLHLAGTPAFILSNKANDQFKFVPGATSQQNLQQLIDTLGKTTTSTNSK